VHISFESFLFIRKNSQMFHGSLIMIGSGRSMTLVTPTTRNVTG